MNYKIYNLSSKRLMLRIDPTDISSTAKLALAKYQGLVDSLEDSPRRGVKIDALWKNRQLNRIFNEIVQKLKDACPGEGRCCYCEGSRAHEIEHIFPKAHFPEQTFRWENFLYVCGECNVIKHSKWPIFLKPDRTRVDLNTLNRRPGERRADGDHVFINQRIDDPLDWICLDINPETDRLEFTPLSLDTDSEEYHRGWETIRILKLNSRSTLGKHRMDQYKNYRSRVRTIVDAIQSGRVITNESQEVVELQKMAHPFVWQEVKRYRSKGYLKKVDPEFDSYFDALPQAAYW